VAATRPLSDGVVALRPHGDEGSFLVEHAGEPVGSVSVEDVGAGAGELRWSLHEDQRGRGYATRALRLLVAHALDDLGLSRVQARVRPGDVRAVRVATRAGLLREGILRVERGQGEHPDATEYVLLARLRSDPPVDDPRGFRTLLNSFLPRKRAIAQMLVRDPTGRVLLCRLTYKSDWDLPGGVVEVGESPRDAVAREVKEELDLDIAAGGLVLTDWLPAWSGWDDALCLVFDGGVHDPSLLDAAALQAREIRSVEFCTVEQARERCADFTARRLESALANLDGGGTSYTESGRA
jgi:ADP-ribose pyrophosphatase YjhB (NUDIX family)